jgi:hypothetical protein
MVVGRSTLPLFLATTPIVTTPLILTSMVALAMRGQCLNMSKVDLVWETLSHIRGKVISLGVKPYSHIWNIFYGHKATKMLCYNRMHIYCS